MTTVRWTFDYDIFNIFEIPTAAVRAVLPDRVHPMEVRPGTSLLAFGLHRFAAGNLNGKLPAFIEANCNVLIQPYRVAGEFPVPRLAMYVLYVSSTCQAFLEYAQEHDKMPCYYDAGLRTDISSDGRHVEVADSTGPMFMLDNPIEPTFTRSSLSGQALSCADGTLHRMNFTWSGQLFEHQKPVAGGDFFAHRSLCGLKVPAGPKRCNSQMLAPVNAAGALDYTRCPPLFTRASA